MKRLAVIGKYVSQSLSPEIHKFIARNTGNELEYDKISIPQDRFEAVVDRLFSEYDGFNVTIPYKLSIIPYLKRTEGDAKVFGAVNTVRINDLSGHNTDGLGFMLMLKSNGVQTSGKDVLLLGAGGAGRSVAKKLLDSGATVDVYDRNETSSRALEAEFDGIKALPKIELTPYYALINASGVGMHKTEGLSPVGEDLISKCSVAIDLIYVPAKSRFLEIAENCGKIIMNGKAMLFYQAYFAACIFAGLTPDRETAKRLFIKYEEEK